MAKRASETKSSQRSGRGLKNGSGQPDRPKSPDGLGSRKRSPAKAVSTTTGASASSPAPTCQADDHTGEPLAIDLDACQRAAAIFRALGDPQRLRILIMLEASERCVSEMSLLLGDSMPAISQRLRLLRSERIVRTRRDGKHVYYGLADEHISRLITNALMHALEHACP